MALKKRANEQLRCALQDASLNNEVACINLMTAAQRLEDEELAEQLLRTIEILRADARVLRAHSEEVEAGKIRRNF